MCPLTFTALALRLRRTGRRPTRLLQVHYRLFVVRMLRRFISRSSSTEIRQYFEDVAIKEGVVRHARLSTEVTGVTWDDAASFWRVSFREIASGREGFVTARFVVSCAGPLHVPKLPDIPGVASFRGTSLHSAKWDDSVNLDGKTVAIVGTGASCVQVSFACMTVSISATTPALLRRSSPPLQSVCTALTSFSVVPPGCYRV